MSLPASCSGPRQGDSQGITASVGLGGLLRLMFSVSGLQVLRLVGFVRVLVLGNDASASVQDSQP